MPKKVKNSKLEYLIKIHKSQTLLDILLAFEEYLDNLDIYTFKNWIDGDVVEGPLVRRYWATIVLKYAYEKMPDPVGGLRILKHGGKVRFLKAKQEIYDLGQKEIKQQSNPVALQTSAGNQIIAQT